MSLTNVLLCGIRHNDFRYQRITVTFQAPGIQRSFCYKWQEESTLVQAFDGIVASCQTSVRRSPFICIFYLRSRRSGQSNYGEAKKKCDILEVWFGEKKKKITIPLETKIVAGCWFVSTLSHVWINQFSHIPVLVQQPQLIQFSINCHAKSVLTAGRASANAKVAYSWSPSGLRRWSREGRQLRR